MRIRLVEEYDPITGSTRWEIERLEIFPPVPRPWWGIYGSRSESEAREVWERIKQSKAVVKVRKVLEIAQI